MKFILRIPRGCSHCGRAFFMPDLIKTADELEGTCWEKMYCEKCLPSVTKLMESIR